MKLKTIIDEKKRMSTIDANPASVPTDFQCRVYGALSKIPCGRVVSYTGLADAVGCRSPRAIGQALRRNPYAPQVPCHRVIAADGRVGGYQGRPQGAAIRQKLKLLADEGVLFQRGRLVDKSLFYYFAGAGGAGGKSRPVSSRFT